MRYVVKGWWLSTEFSTRAEAKEYLRRTVRQTQIGLVVLTGIAAAVVTVLCW